MLKLRTSSIASAPTYSSSVRWRSSVRSRSAQATTKTSERKPTSHTTRSKGPSILYPQEARPATRRRLVLAPRSGRNWTGSLRGHEGNVLASLRCALQRPTPRETGDHDQHCESYH